MPIDIQRKGWATLADHEAVLAAVDVLIATSHCREVRAATSTMGGTFGTRPSVGNRPAQETREQWRQRLFDEMRSYCTKWPDDTACGPNALGGGAGR